MKDIQTDNDEVSPLFIQAYHYIQLCQKGILLYDPKYNPKLQRDSDNLIQKLVIVPQHIKLNLDIKKFREEDIQTLQNEIICVNQLWKDFLILLQDQQQCQQKFNQIKNIIESWNKFLNDSYQKNLLTQKNFKITKDQIDVQSSIHSTFKNPKTKDISYHVKQKNQIYQKLIHPVKSRQIKSLEPQQLKNLKEDQAHIHLAFKKIRDLDKLLKDPYQNNVKSRTGMSSILEHQKNNSSIQVQEDGQENISLIKNRYDQKKKQNSPQRKSQIHQSPKKIVNLTMSANAPLQRNFKKTKKDNPIQRITLFDIQSYKKRQQLMQEMAKYLKYYQLQ